MPKIKGRAKAPGAPAMKKKPATPRAKTAKAKARHYRLRRERRRKVW
jgi:hypothetical protein